VLEVIVWAKKLAQTPSRNSACSTALYKAMLLVDIEDRTTLFSLWNSQYMQATGTLLVVTSSVVINKNIPPEILA
jgi:hypothetical protein